MPRPRSNMASAQDAGSECIGCGTCIPLNDTILLKFHRCYYCGQHHPHGNQWRNHTAPVLIAAAIGLIALLWKQL